MHHIGTRTLWTFALLAVLILGVAVDLRLSLHKLPDQLGSIIERAIKENTVQKLITTFKYDADPDPEKVAPVTTTVETPRNAGENVADWNTRHEEAVTASMTGKTIIA